MIIEVLVKPGSHKEGVSALGANRYRVALREPAREGMANEALREVLAEHFGITRSRVRLVRGGKSRIKLVEITDGL